MWKAVALAISVALLAVLVFAIYSYSGSTQPAIDPAGVVRPNPILTPGDVLPATRAEVCVSGYASRTRDVSSNTKDDVYAEYGLPARHEAGAYEVDHLVPLSIGGSNDIKNLWPEPASPKPGFHEKDRLELALHQLVCGGKLDLAEAQHAVASDWWAAYLRYVK